jgi:hypothetical protein
MHNNYITKNVFEFLFALARGKIGWFFNSYLLKETILLGRGRIG